MQIGSEQWRQLIISGAAQLNITVTTDQAHAFAQHAGELIHWNRKINLTAIVEPRELAVKHFLDAIAPLAWIPDQGELLDVGTGGGFPGVALSIMRPHQPMTFIDGSHKKITFVKHVIRLLSLENARALHIRSEVLCRSNQFQGRFHAVVSRAVADPLAMVKMTSGLLAPAGKIFVYQGPKDANIPASHPELLHLEYHLKVVDYMLPVTGDARKLFIFQLKA